MLSLGGGTGGGIREPQLTCSILISKVSVLSCDCNKCSHKKCGKFRNGQDDAVLTGKASSVT